MNGFSAAATSSSSSVPPPNSTSETNRPATRPEFSSFTFKSIGQPPTLLSRFSGAGATSDYRSPSPERSDMDVASSEDPTMTATEDHRAPRPVFRKTLLERVGGNADHQGHNPKAVITQTQDPGVLESIATSPPSASSSRLVFPRPESRLSSISRQLSVAVDVPRVDAASPRTSVAPETQTYEPPDSDMIDPYADPASPSPSPLSLYEDVSELVRESDELDRITDLHRLLIAEREELLTRYEEITRALSRTKAQLDRVLSLTDQATQMTTVFVDKEKARLATKKAEAEANIERRKNLEMEQHRRARELERIRQHEEERKVQAEIQQAECKRLEELRKKEEALAAERQRQEEIQARERAQAEECRRLEEEERRLAEDRRKRDEEERKRQAEERRKEEEEHLQRRLAEEREALARKQEEDRRTQLLERRRLAEDERKRKEVEAAAAKAEAEKQAAEKEQQRIFQERRATVLMDKYRNYNQPESRAPPTGSGSSSTLEGTLSPDLPSIIVNNVPTNPQSVVEQHPGLAKIHRARDTPTFVPATTDAGRLPPDLSQRVKISDSLVDRAVKNEATSPVITPVNNDQPVEDASPTQLPSRPISSMSTSAPAPPPAPLSALPHLPAKPVTIYSHPPVPLQQRGRSPRRYPRRSRSRSRPSSRSPRRGSPISRTLLRTSRSPDTARGRYDHYSPPRSPYRDGGSRYDRDSRSDSPPPPPPNPRKRTLAEDSWANASTPSKLDYSHPSKRRAASPLRSRSPPSPRPRLLTHPPPIVSARRQPPPGRRGKGAGPSSHIPLEQRLSRPPQLSDRIR